MLIFNIERICKARGIEKPYSFFVANGFSEGYAAKLNKGKVANIKLPYLEKICEILYCTPNDLMEWEPNKDSRISKDHPLWSLKNTAELPDMTNALKTISLDKINMIKEYIEKEVVSESDETSPKQLPPGL